MHQPQANTPEVDRDTLIRRHLPLVRRVARRHAGRLPAGVELDDLISWGTFGLLAAVERYEPSREALFPAYARFRIRGAILDHLRQHDWMPRSVREKAREVARAARQAERRLGRPATEDELAGTLGLSVAGYRTLLDEIAPIALVGLEDLESDAEIGWPSTWGNLQPLDTLLDQERARLVADAVHRLPEREQLLLSLYYRDELTMKEVGGVLGVTESRVSQLHTQALLRLRAWLERSAPADRARRGGGLKVRSRTTDHRTGVAWERPENETPCGRRSGGGGSRGSAGACEPDATFSTPMRSHGRSATRSAAALFTTDAVWRSHDAACLASREPAGQEPDSRCEARSGIVGRAPRVPGTRG